MCLFAVLQKNIFLFLLPIYPPVLFVGLLCAMRYLPTDRGVYLYIILLLMKAHKKTLLILIYIPTVTYKCIQSRRIVYRINKISSIKPNNIMLCKCVAQTYN